MNPPTTTTLEELKAAVDEEIDRLEKMSDEELMEFYKDVFNLEPQVPVMAVVSAEENSEDDNENSDVISQPKPKKKKQSKASQLEELKKFLLTENPNDI